jgi:serine/threonine protein kinase
MASSQGMTAHDTTIQDPTMRSPEETRAARRPRRLMRHARFPRALEAHLVSAPIAAGGMASVHVAMSADPRQPVLALKRVHPHLASDDFTTMLLDEAAIASCIRHENVVTTYGADMIGEELFMVMEYVAGLPLHIIMQKARPGTVPVRFAVAIIADALRGLHAAHEATDASGKPLGIVHRDVSPQNMLLGVDGITRVLDFGVAKAEHRHQRTRAGELKGKLSYMSPEQLRGDPVDRRTDVYAAAVVLWEALVGASLFNGRNDGGTFANALRGCSTRPGARVAGVPVALDAIVMRGLAMSREDRFATALDMARALDGVVASNPVRREELAAWLRERGADVLRRQARVPAELRRRATPALNARATSATTVRRGGNRSPALAVSLHDAAMASPLDQKLAIRAVLFVTGSAFGLLLAMVILNAFGAGRSLAVSPDRVTTTTTIAAEESSR